VWDVRDPFGRKLIYTAFASGWLIVLLSTFLINHFDLFGLRQVWLYFRRKPYTALPFKTPVFYRVVRHPPYVGGFLVVWSTPTMTSAHLLFAVMTSVYILIGIQLEEHDLTQMHPEYAQYRRQVPMLVPSVKRRGRIGGRVAARS